MAQAVRDTQILNRDFKCWDWDLIGSLLKVRIGNVLHKQLTFLHSFKNTYH